MSQLWSINSLAVELGMDRRSLSRALDDLSPDEESKDVTGRVSKKWRMARVFEHLLAGGTLDATRERARKDKEMADKLALENRLRRGEMVETEACMREFGSVISDARARLIQLPDALGQFCDPKYATIVTAEARKRVYEALEELSSGLARAVEATPDPDGEPVGGSQSSPINGKQRGAGAVED